MVAEDDFIRLRPADVGLHFTRVDVDRRRSLREQLEQMAEDAPAAARVLSKADVDVIAFACTSATFLDGRAASKAVAARIGEAAGVPSVTTSESVVEALHALGARRVALATPYVSWVVDAQRRFLEESGFEVTAAVGLERTGGSEISLSTSDEVRSLVSEADSSDADAVLVSCTDLPVLELVEELEHRHGKPVVTSNQATYWRCARALALRPIDGYGELLSRYL